MKRKNREERRNKEREGGRAKGKWCSDFPRALSVT